jgi:hemin uptake protein HemP
MKQHRGDRISCSRGQQTIRRIDSKSLLAGDNRLRIEHEGVDYLLQITRQGKLILTK